MSYSIKHAEEYNCIEIVVHGKVTRQMAFQWTEEAHALGRKLGISAYLVNVTDAVNVDTTLDQYQFANMDIRESAGFDRFAKVAILTAPDDRSHDFIETVCRNAGLNFRLFRDHQEALAFLGYKR